jgi:hypothetical protein
MKLRWLILILGLSLIGGNAFAADGDLIVNGKLGLGVETPYTKLHVSGTGRFQNWASGAYLEILGVGDTYNFSGLQLMSDETVSKTWQLMHKKISTMPNYFTIEEYDGSTWSTRITVKPGGKTGIGTIYPAVALDVNGGVRVGAESSYCDQYTEGTIRYNSTSKNMEFCNGTTWKVFTSQ